MGHWEDFWVETHQELKELGLQKKFDEQLEKMNTQDKHRYKDTRSKWQYAKDKVVKEHWKKIGKHEQN